MSRRIHGLRCEHVLTNSVQFHDFVRKLLHPAEACADPRDRQPYWFGRGHFV